MATRPHEHSETEQDVHGFINEAESPLVPAPNPAVAQSPRVDVYDVNKRETKSTRMWYRKRARQFQARGRIQNTNRPTNCITRILNDTWNKDSAKMALCMVLWMTLLELVEWLKWGVFLPRSTFSILTGIQAFLAPLYLTSIQILTKGIIEFKLRRRGMLVRHYLSWCSFFIAPATRLRFAHHGILVLCFALFSTSLLQLLQAAGAPSIRVPVEGGFTSGSIHFLISATGGYTGGSYIMTGLRAFFNGTDNLRVPTSLKQQTEFERDQNRFYFLDMKNKQVFTPVLPCMGTYDIDNTQPRVVRSAELYQLPGTVAEYSFAWTNITQAMFQSYRKDTARANFALATVEESKKSESEKLKSIKISIAYSFPTSGFKNLTIRLLIKATRCTYRFRTFSIGTHIEQVRDCVQHEGKLPDRIRAIEDGIQEALNNFLGPYLGSRLAAASKLPGTLLEDRSIGKIASAISIRASRLNDDDLAENILQPNAPDALGRTMHEREHFQSKLWFIIVLRVLVYGMIIMLLVISMFPQALDMNVEQFCALTSEIGSNMMTARCPTKSVYKFGVFEDEIFGKRVVLGVKVHPETRDRMGIEILKMGEVNGSTDPFLVNRYRLSIGGKESVDKEFDEICRESNAVLG
jgi:hypothetical protein